MNEDIEIKMYTLRTDTGVYFDTEEKAISALNKISHIKV